MIRRQGDPPGFFENYVRGMLAATRMEKSGDSGG